MSKTIATMIAAMAIVRYWRFRYASAFLDGGCDFLHPLVAGWQLVDLGNEEDAVQCCQNARHKSKNQRCCFHESSLS